MNVFRKAMDYQWIHEDLMPMEKSFIEVNRVLTESTWVCPCCGKKDCWDYISLPEDVDLNQTTTDCPAGTFVVWLADLWEVEASTAIRILSSVELAESLGIRIEPHLNLADRLVSSIYVAAENDFVRDGDSGFPASQAEWLEVLPRKDKDATVTLSEEVLQSIR